MRRLYENTTLFNVRDLSIQDFGKGRLRGWEAGGRGPIYRHLWLIYDRNQHNIVIILQLKKQSDSQGGKGPEMAPVPIFHPVLEFLLCSGVHLGHQFE